jgi:hypothetical protein
MAWARQVGQLRASGPGGLHKLSPASWLQVHAEPVIPALRRSRTLTLRAVSVVVGLFSGGAELLPRVKHARRRSGATRAPGAVACPARVHRWQFLRGAVCTLRLWSLLIRRRSAGNVLLLRLPRAPRGGAGRLQRPRAHGRRQRAAQRRRRRRLLVRLGRAARATLRAAPITFSLFIPGHGTHRRARLRP